MITVCGQNVSLKDLEKVKVETPKRISKGVSSGSTWKGIQHGMLIHSILGSITNMGWDVGQMQFALSNNKADMVGAFDLAIPEIDAPNGQSFSLGIMTSNSMKRSLRLFVGTRIFICNNGLATGEIVMKKRHTLYLDLDFEIEDALRMYFRKAKEVKSVVVDMQKYDLSNEAYEHVLVEAGRQDVLPWSRVGKVCDEYNNPRYPEFEPRNCWSLYNAFTQVVKESPALSQMDKLNQFRLLLPCSV